ncbi:MAG: NAD/NADP octopine/nopaline dehydrogenase family protein [Candidatus Lokiarchaeota archaeon]|nr:NAD/NADP octopine/nopaline dehydrogenase family protein [Candidatus Lokiarchaeota archaeon]
MIDYNNVAIIGAGNGGRATAIYLRNRGFNINLAFRTFEKIKTIYFTKQIRSQGKLNGIFDLDLITPEYSQLMAEDVGVIIYVLPANVHADITRKIAPFLQNNQIILLTPGRTWGAIEVNNIIKRLRPELRVYVGETQTLPFTSRSIEDKGVDLIDIKNQVKYCFYPEKYNQRVSKTIFKLFPRLLSVDDIRITSLNNIGAMVHPAGLILNTGTISRKQDLLFYSEGMSKDVVKIVEQVDTERCTIMKLLGLKPVNFLQWATEVYNVREKDYYSTFQHIRSYQAISAPKQMNVRYITEDVPTGLVPISSIGKFLGIPTPATDALINIANILMDTDFRVTGRTTKNVGVPVNLLIPKEEQKYIVSKVQELTHEDININVTNDKSSSS